MLDKSKDAPRLSRDDALAVVLNTPFLERRGVVAKVAAQAGVCRQTIYNWLRQATQNESGPADATDEA